MAPGQAVTPTLALAGTRTQPLEHWLRLIAWSLVGLLIVGRLALFVAWAFGAHFAADW